MTTESQGLAQVLSHAMSRPTSRPTSRQLGHAISRRKLIACGFAASWSTCADAAGAVDSVFAEELTWTEFRDRVATGSTTLLVPIGGTEQNGPHMVLGKHNVRVRLLAGLIAKSLGAALVAPVMAYVPEGGIDPPVAHMRYAGTVSISEAEFEAVLESTARSYKRHGLRDIVLLGDHGGYQRQLQRVADKLNREWRNPASAADCRVHALSEYYQASSRGHAQLLAARGFSAAEIGTHAGLADTALTLALDPTLVRSEAQGRVGKPGSRDGVSGDPSKASAQLGQLGVEHIVAASVAAIRARVSAR